MREKRRNVVVQASYCVIGQSEFQNGTAIPCGNVQSLSAGDSAAVACVCTKVVDKLVDSGPARQRSGKSNVLADRRSASLDTTAEP